MLKNLFRVNEEMSKTLVSVVITTYNRPESLRKALESVKKQTYSPIEIVVVDDAGKIPADKSISDKNVVFVRHKINKGLALARNTGFRKARGEYVAFLDDDDEFLPEKIEKQVEALSSKGDEYAFIYCGQKVVRPNGSYFIISPKHRGNIKAGIIKRGISSISSTYLFRKEALEEVGGFDERLRNSIDHDMWMTFASKGWYCDYVDEALTLNYREVGRSRMTTNLTIRVMEIDKYIKKWTPVFKKWFKQDYEEYVSSYRMGVYSMLAYDLLMKSDLKSALIIYRRALFMHPIKAILYLPRFSAKGALLFSLSILYRFIPPQSIIRYF